MTLLVRVGGEDVEASITAKGDKVEVILDGQTFAFNVEGAGQERTVTHDGKTWTVERTGNSILVNGTLLPLEILRANTGRELAMKSGTTQVRPPMTGRLESIRVQPGQSVQKGDVLFVLEAMKMLNEVRSPVAGIVKAVHVQAGATVEPHTKVMDVGT